MSEQPYEGSWAIAHLTCPICGHHTISTYPVVCVRLQCVGCDYMMEAPELPVQFDDDGFPVPRDRDLYDALNGINLLGDDQEEAEDGDHE